MHFVVLSTSKWIQLLWHPSFRRQSLLLRNVGERLGSRHLSCVSSVLSGQREEILFHSLLPAFTSHVQPFLPGERVLWRHRFTSSESRLLREDADGMAQVLLESRGLILLAFSDVSFETCDSKSNWIQGVNRLHHTGPSNNLTRITEFTKIGKESMC